MSALKARGVQLDPKMVVKSHLDEAPTVVRPPATGRLQATQGGSVDCLVLTPAFRLGTIFGPLEGFEVSSTSISKKTSPKSMTD
jgi:hypothetical protein